MTPCTDAAERLLYLGGRDGRLRAWDLASGAPLPPPPPEERSACASAPVTAALGAAATALPFSAHACAAAAGALIVETPPIDPPQGEGVSIPRVALRAPADAGGWAEAPVWVSTEAWPLAALEMRPAVEWGQ